jgi:hypothetical protein
MGQVAEQVQGPKLKTPVQAKKKKKKKSFHSFESHNCREKGKHQSSV